MEPISPRLVNCCLECGKLDREAGVMATSYLCLVCFRSLIDAVLPKKESKAIRRPNVNLGRSRSNYDYTKPPEERCNLEPHSEIGKSLCREFAKGNTNFNNLGRKYKVAPAYVEKCYFKNFLPARLLAKIEAMQAKRAAS